MGLVFWNSIHLEVASDSFCLLCNSSWLLVFILLVFYMIFSGFNLYCWKGIHFSKNNFLIFLLLFLGLIFSFHFWFRDLLRELDKKYEVLLIIFFLVFLLFIVSEGLLFVSFFWTSFHFLKHCFYNRWMPFLSKSLQFWGWQALYRRWQEYTVRIFTGKPVLLHEWWVYCVIKNR